MNRPASASSKNYGSDALWDSLFQEAEQAGLGVEAAPETPLSFREFITRVNPRYQFYRHCEELIGVLQRVADDELRRVMIFLPPRHSKSETVSRLFTAYYLYRHPDRFVGVASYGADLAYTLSRAARENFTKSGGVLNKASRAVKHWLTQRGGGLWAAGVGGPATGKGFHLGVIDDPTKDAQEAQSETTRARQKDWYGSVFSTREEPGGAIVILQTRWHEDDLSGYVLSLEDDEPEHWYVVNLPAIRDVSDEPTFPASCTVHPDWRADGEALCEERYPLERLKKLAKRIGAFWFGALFQQRPRPREGTLFSRGVSIVDAVPSGARYVRYWDTAGADTGKGDWTAGVLLAKAPDGCWYVVDVEHFQLPANERNDRIKQTAELDRQTYGRVQTYVERPPGLAKESTEAIIRHLAGYLVTADPVSGDKVGRAEPFAAQWQAGNVKLIKGRWNAAYLNEFTAFPTGKHDDQVDGTSGAFNRLTAGTQTGSSMENPFF